MLGRKTQREQAALPICEHRLSIVAVSERGREDWEDVGDRLAVRQQVDNRAPAGSG
jgi:hypothetical protein